MHMINTLFMQLNKSIKERDANNCILIINVLLNTKSVNDDDKSYLLKLKNEILNN